MKVPNIKFNLRFFAPDGSEVAIRSLADLARNLNLSDLWDYFKAGDLARWLKSIGEEAKADSIAKLDPNASNIRSSLDNVCRILDLNVQEQEIISFSDMEMRHLNRSSSKSENDSEPGEETYFALIRRLIEYKLDIYSAYEVMVKILKYYPDSFARDVRDGMFLKMSPCIYILMCCLDDACKVVFGLTSYPRPYPGPYPDFIKHDEYHHRYYGFGWEVNDSGTGNLNTIMEIGEGGGPELWHGGYRCNLCLKKEVVDRLREINKDDNFSFDFKMDKIEI